MELDGIHLRVLRELAPFIRGNSGNWGKFPQRLEESKYYIHLSKSMKEDP